MATQLVGWGVVAIPSAVWVGIDARSRDFSKSGFARLTWEWVFGTLVLWIVFFPIYLVKRRTAPAKT